MCQQLTLCFNSGSTTEDNRSIPTGDYGICKEKAECNRRG